MFNIPYKNLSDFTVSESQIIPIWRLAIATTTLILRYQLKIQLVYLYLNRQNMMTILSPTRNHLQNVLLQMDIYLIKQSAINSLDHYKVL